MTQAAPPHDWPERLEAALRASAARPEVVYGDHDCALHACDAALAKTGTDPGAPFRGRYDSYLSGLRLLAERTGARTLAAWADGLWEAIPVAMAGRGDWVLVEAPAESGGRPHPVLTVCDGEKLYGPCGVSVGRELGVKAWRVALCPL